MPKCNLIPASFALAMTLSGAAYAADDAQKIELLYTQVRTLTAAVSDLEKKVAQQEDQIADLLVWSKTIREWSDKIAATINSIGGRQSAGYDYTRGIGLGEQQKNLLHPRDASGFEGTPGPTIHEIHVRTCK
jgi:outer membrane murein-binding lipoprotein Lpp